jgi:hypothetical protein
MSSGLFHTDWYTAPPWDDLSLSWLLNYVKNIRTNPELVKAITAEKEQFEMVPMPKEVIQHLAASRQVSTSVGLASPKNLEVVTDIVRRFGRALESEKVDEAVALLSPNYHDAFGRDARRMRELLRSVASAGSKLRIVPFNTESIIQLKDHLIANLQVAWEVTVKEGGKDAAKSAFSNVELVLENSGRGWVITSVRVV